jgi:hypothetical protein
MKKNIIIAALAVIAIGLSVLLIFRHPGKLDKQIAQNTDVECRQLMNELLNCYSQMDIPGFYSHFSKEQGAVHIFGMKAYTSVDSLMNQLTADFTRVSGMKMQFQGTQVLPLDPTHALVTCQGTVKYNFINKTDSALMIYNWMFYLEKRDGKWIVVRSQQGFSA